MNSVDAGAQVIAPEQVAVWVPTFSKPVYPLYTRLYYQCYLALRVDSTELEFRRALMGSVSQPDNRLHSSKSICALAERNSIDGWCVENLDQQTNHAFSASSECGFQEVDAKTSKFQIWTRHLSGLPTAHDNKGAPPRSQPNGLR